MSSALGGSCLSLELWAGHDWQISLLNIASGVQSSRVLQSSLTGTISLLPDLLGSALCFRKSFVLRHRIQVRHRLLALFRNFVQIQEDFRNLRCRLRPVNAFPFQSVRVCVLNCKSLELSLCLYSIEEVGFRERLPFSCYSLLNSEFSLSHHWNLLLLQKPCCTTSNSKSFQRPNQIQQVPQPEKTSSSQSLNFS